MKTLLFSLLLAFAFLFGNLDSVKAQCPENWGTNFTHDTIVVNYNGCEITIIYCATYTEAGEYYIVYKDIQWVFNNGCDGTFFNTSSFWAFLDNKILLRYYGELQTHIAPCGAVQGTYTTHLNIGKAYCWKLVIEPTGLPTPNDKLMTYKNCDTPYGHDIYNGFKGCLKKYKQCWDMTQNPPFLRITFIGEQIDVPNCNMIGMPNYSQQQLNMLPVPYESECYFSSCQFAE